jgi:GWxTD domain-containing protein
VEIEDLRSHKPGLLYVGRKAHREGKAEGVFFVPDLGAGAVAVSELEPAWSIRTQGRGGAFQRAGVEVVPNPGRTFGLYQSTLRAYYELGPAGLGGMQPVTARILDPQGSTVLEAQSDSVDVSGRTWGQVAFDVSTLGAGAYDLDVSVGTGAGATARRLRFNVAWHPETWQDDPRQLADEVAFLLDDVDQEEGFARLSLGEQEAFLDRYWAAKDPSPGTAVNEVRQRFQERVAYANAHFGIAGLVHGMLSDRGRVYVRYGEPDEIRREVMPTQGLQVEDIAREVATEEGFNSAVRLKGRGGGADMRSFEIWTYDRLLHPEDELREGSGPRRPMRQTFVFVDEEGYGDYVLRYSNE